MRGRRDETVRLMAVLGAGIATMGALAGTAVAAPVPKPPAQQVAGPRPPAPQQAATGHSGHAAGRAKAGHPRPRTVVRCQNDETDQIDEFDTDRDEPRHIVTPAGNTQAGHCAGSRDAIEIARILAGEHRARPRAARLVRLARAVSWFVFLACVVVVP